MPKRETDISLIRKYHNGELDARAMHQLERRAQDDPFLMDALEGYERAAGNQQVQLDDLTNRLQQRTAKKERRIIPFRFMAIAASILVILTIGGLWLYRSQPVNNNNKVAKLVKPAEVKAPVATPTAITPEKKQEIVALKTAPPVKQQQKLYDSYPNAVVKADAMAEPVQQVQVADMENKKAGKVAKDTTPLNEVIAMSYADQPKKDVKAANRITLKEVAITPTDKLLQAKVPGVNIETRKIPQNLPGLNYNPILNNIIGLVIDKNDRSPLPGASVKVAGTNIQAVTDMNGKFVLPADSGKAKLIINSIGYQTASINTNPHDSVKTIALQPDNKSLSEVVVVGYGTKKEAAITATTNAHPKNGQDNFNNYLKENAVSPHSKKGTVTVSFMVDADGNISDVKVIKGLSKVTDQKAIDLISNGPDWIGNANGKPEKVTLKIVFAK